MSNLYSERTCIRGEEGWIYYKRESVITLPGFIGFKTLSQLMEEALKTNYYSKPHPFLDPAYREQRRREICQMDQALLATSFLLGGRISEVLMAHIENFTFEDQFIVVKGLPTLKRFKKTATSTEILDRPESGQIIPKGYTWSSTYGAYVKNVWVTEAKLEEREDFCIGLWEPYVNILLEWIREATKKPPGEGGYKWLFPSPLSPEREESKGIQGWIKEKFNLESRAWYSPERAYTKVRTIGERLGLHIYDHWFRSQRASMLSKYYHFDERLLNRYFSWAGSWTSSGKSMASHYARTSIDELMEKMAANRKAVEIDYKEIS